jgi:hypothetical protein
MAYSLSYYLSHQVILILSKKPFFVKHLFSPSILAFRYCSLLILGGATIMSVHGQSFAPVSNYSTGVNSTPEDVAVGDVNGDGRLDIVSANFTTENVGVLLGQANGFAPVVTYPLGKGAYPTSVALGDVRTSQW